MAKKRKRDFWDDPDDGIVLHEKGPKHSEPISDNDDRPYEEGFKATKSMPLKVLARILLFVAAAVVGVSVYIGYKYIDDRYAQGVYSSSYFDSTGFSVEYNNHVNNLIKLLTAVEQETDPTEERLTDMVNTIMGSNSNFSFLVLNEDKERVVVSGEDAKTRIESSNHYIQIVTLNEQFEVVPSVPVKGLNRSAWKSALEECTNAYNIYTAVDNNLSQQDSFYTSYLQFQKLGDYFNLAKIAGIAALVLFILLLIYCIMSTGMFKGEIGVRLNWFDRIFTEFAAIILAAVIGALIYGLIYLMGHDVPFNNILKGVDLFLLYMFIIRGYFSLVRRIKAGTFISNSLIYKIGSAINRGLNHLPKPVKVIIILIFLAALNGGLVYALMNLRDYTVGSIPIIFIAAPIIFLIELIAFISCIFGVGDTQELEAYDEEDEDASQTSAADDQAEADWENVDFSGGLEGITPGFEDHSQASEGATQEHVLAPATDKTMVLTQEEQSIVSQMADANQETQMLDAGAINESLEMLQPSKPTDENSRVRSVVVPEVEEPTPAADENYVDFIQLNKDVRKLFKMKLKTRNLGVTLRVPEQPIWLDIDKANAIKLLSILFENIVAYAQEGSRIYIEMYIQNGKMIYLMKNTIREDLVEQKTTAMGAGLTDAKRIVTAETGKFITNVDGDTYKVGIMLDTMDV